MPYPRWVDILFIAWNSPWVKDKVELTLPLRLSKNPKTLILGFVTTRINNT